MTKDTAKIDNLQPDHVKWLLQSRYDNQCAALSLHQLLTDHAKAIEVNSKYSSAAQALVGVCFALWRAAFLADKSGERQETLSHARIFLGKILTDNTIGYPQDRASRGWTFNYYMQSAGANLKFLRKSWPDIHKAAPIPKKGTKARNSPVLRWKRQQTRFEAAIEAFRTDLEK